MSVLTVVCSRCHESCLEKGEGLHAGLFTCRSCKRNIGRMVLAVDLVNSGWEMGDVADATGMTVPDIRRNLRMNYRLERNGTCERWVDKGYPSSVIAIMRKEVFA